MKLLEVVICGNNQYMNNLAEKLIADRRSRVTRSGDYLPDVVWELGMVCPDVVIFEIGSDSKIPDAAIFAWYPAVKFIGINVKDSVMAVFFNNGQTVESSDKLDWEVRKMVSGRAVADV